MQVNTGEKKIIIIDAAKREIIRGLFIFLLISLVFIFLRFFLKLFGANPDTAFVSFVYIVSGVFLLPFFGIFPDFEDSLPGDSMIDIVALIAFFCYLILIQLAMGVIQIGASILKTGKKVTETVEHNNPVNDESEIVSNAVK